MAGTAKQVRITGHAESDLYNLIKAFNQLLTDFDAHTHGGVTAGAAATAVPTASTATPIYDANTGAAPA
jgi:hypothetical protein